ncbi:MAG: trimethylamine methyltransferase family protein, partial [Deltaproteobacteria bacterium]|nr:trimethylamine methyltransferase family protein [Deltaproteobacteria bacterium]
KRNFHAGRRLSSGLSLNILTDDELEEIHHGTLEVLNETGVFVEDENAMNCFEQGGAVVDRDTKIVKIPPYMVEDAIRSAPSKVVLYGRDPKHDIVLESTRVYFTNFSEGVMVNDPFTGENRSPMKQDLIDSAKVIDYLPEIDFCEKALGAHDVSQETVPLHNAEAYLTNTTKHCAFGPGNGKFLNKIIKMGEAIAGGVKEFKQRPLVSFTTCPVSPLKLIADCCEIIMEAARNNVVCNILSMAMAGGTAPVTLAGTLVNHNAEVLSGITLAQLTRRGTPVIYGSSTTAMDLKLASASVGTPECALISGAVARLARYYLLPSYVAGQ